MGIKFKEPPSVDRLRELFDYHENQVEIGGHRCIGGFRWQHRLDCDPAWNARYEGKPVGTWAKDNRVYVMVEGSQFQLSVLVWAYHGRDLPRPMVIDHQSRDRLDNRIGNLRLASMSGNGVNKAPVPGTSSQFLGVYLNKYGRWAAQIKKDRKVSYLGQFDLEEDAARARDAAALRMFGEFAVLNFPKDDVDASPV